jgi:peptidase A4-like protein
MRRIFAAAVPVLIVFALVAPASATAVQQRRIHALNASQSNNWSGYNKGALDVGKVFRQVSGTWVVPTATQHTSGKAEFSSVWVGIGGGCLNSSCLLTDSTLIQTGTEQDVAANGAASYSAWWEIIPAPSITISNFPVRPGDRMTANIASTVPGVWTITLANNTTGRTFNQTVPYPSTMGSAEWIVETPLIIGTNAGFSSLPNLSRVTFDLAQVNVSSTSLGLTSANLTAADEIQLVNGNGAVIADPSAPDAQRDGFSVCTYTSNCV